MRKSLKFLFLAAVVVAVSTSCREQRDFAYVKDAARDSAMTVVAEFSKGIQPNDILYIYVESQTAEAMVPFNQETNKIAVASSGMVMNPGSSTAQGYLVNQDGEIIFPVLGKISVLGMTHDELAKTIEQKLIAGGYVTDPVVTVKLTNFKVCVLGEVARPGQLLIQGERVTIFEALSMVGDMTIYGQRENVTVIREENGKRIIGTLNLASKDVFDSPYYYLHQNDVVFVEPNKRKRVNADRDPMIMTYVSSAISVVSVISSVFYYYILSKYYSNRN